MSSAKAPPGPKVSDKDVQALLQRHRCPTPLHALRTLLLGNIASPRMDVSPMTALAQAWDGELPQFDSAAQVEELMRVLVQGLWNSLSQHQNSRTPFRLPRFEVLPTREAVLDLARMRAQEVGGFVDGLFGDEEEMGLPHKAHEAVKILLELQAMLDGAAAVLADESKPAPQAELKALLRHLQQMTVIADEQINRALQSCKRARAQHLGTMATVMSSRMTTAQDNGEGAVGGDEEGDAELIESPLSQSVTRHGVTVRVEIYRSADSRWILEIIDVENASHVWDEHFETDQQALDEAMRALDEEPLEFLGRSAQQRLN